MPSSIVWRRGLSSSLQGSIHLSCRRQPRFVANDALGSKIATSSTQRYSHANEASVLAYSVEKCVERVFATEIELSLTDGMILRGQRWTHRNHPQNEHQIAAAAAAAGGDIDEHPDQQAASATTTAHPSTTRILALHGWLDNCRSFYCLAPRLIEKLGAHVELIAIDLPGHGRSSHRPIDGPTAVLSEGAYYIAEVLEALGWGGGTTSSGSNKDNDKNTNEDETKVTLIGHSMGGGMAVTYAGIFPEQIESVVSLDMFGPEPGNPQDAAAQIRSHVVQRRGVGPSGRPHFLYPSLERAIERRVKAAQMAPGGHQYLSLEASTELVTRSTMPVYATTSDDDDDKDDETIPKGYRFRHDARMMWPSLQYLTAEQIESILDRVDCRVCLLAAEDGYPFPQERIDRALARLEPETYEVLPGSHHFHADPDTAGAVVDTICEFLDGNDNSAMNNSEKGKTTGEDNGKAKPSHETVANYGMQ